MMTIHVLKKYILGCGFGLILCYSSIASAQVNTACDAEPFVDVQKSGLLKNKNRTVSQNRFIRSKPSARKIQSTRSPLETRLIMSEGDVTILNPFGQAKLPTKSDGSSNLMDGDRIRTGEQSFVTLQTHDDTFLTLASHTDLLLSNIKQSPIRLELAQGNVESLVTKQKPTERKSNYQIKTSAVTLSVRGTRFKVMHSPSNGNTHVTVEDGLVVAQLRQVCSQPVMLAEGDGAVASATHLQVKDMLPKSVDIIVPPVDNGETLKVSSKPVSNAVLYRVQASLDESAMLVVKEAYGTTPNLVLEGLDNGYYFVRFSAIDANGIEGFSDISTVLYQPPPNSNLWLVDFLKP